jgi:hypothetical protein
MKNRKKIIIIVSYIFQTLLGLLNIAIIFFDSSPNLGETGVLMGAIFLVHGLAILVHNKKNIKKSYLVIIAGYLISAVILSHQDKFPNWFVTGVGGIGLVDGFIALAWPAVVSLGTISLFNNSKIKLSKKRILVLFSYFFATWISLILISLSIHPYIIEASSPVIDIWGMLMEIGPLFGIPIFLLSFGMTGLISGGSIFLILSLNYFFKPKHLGQIILIPFFLGSCLIIGIQKPWVELDLLPQYFTWNVETSKLYTFQLNELEISVPCPVKPIISEKSFNCDDGLVTIEMIEDEGSAYSLAVAGESIAYYEEPISWIGSIGEFNKIGIYEEECWMTRPRVAYPEALLEITTKICGPETWNKYLDYSYELLHPLYYRLRLPEGGFVSEY